MVFVVVFSNWSVYVLCTIEQSITYILLFFKIVY